MQLEEELPVQAEHELSCTEGTVVKSLHVYGFSKAYAEPESVPASSFACAPMIAVLPLMATEYPN